jgi:hypothetical protein
VLALLAAWTIHADPVPDAAFLTRDQIAPLLIAHQARCGLVRDLLAAMEAPDA